jgi:ankyrin repeat protein
MEQSSYLPTDPALSGKELLVDACRKNNLKVVEEILPTLSIEEIRYNDNAALYFASAGNRVKIVQQLLKYLKLEDVRSQNNHALNYACGHSNVQMVLMLLNMGIGADDLRSNPDILYHARHNPNLLRLFQVYGLTLKELGPTFDIHKPTPVEEEIKYDREALHNACLASSTRLVREILEHDSITLEDIRSDDNLALYYACARNNLKIVQLLFNGTGTGQGLSVEDVRSRNNRALNYACIHGNVKLVQLLIDRGLTLDDIRANNNAALKSAHNNVKLLQLHVGRGITFDEMRARNNAAIESSHGYHQIVKCLMHYGITQEEVDACDN